MLYDSILLGKRGAKTFGFIRSGLVLLSEEHNLIASFDFRARGVCDRLEKAKKGQFIFMPYNP